MGRTVDHLFERKRSNEMIIELSVVSSWSQVSTRIKLATRIQTATSSNTASLTALVPTISVTMSPFPSAKCSLLLIPQENKSKYMSILARTFSYLKCGGTYLAFCLDIIVYKNDVQKRFQEAIKKNGRNGIMFSCVVATCVPPY